MSRRRVVKPRFFVFLAMLILIPVGIIAFRMYSSVQRYAVVMQGATTTSIRVDAVVMMDETVTSSETTARIEFVAKEGTVVKSGDEIAYIYSAGYTESELTKLESIRENIQAYHKTLLSNIVDARLDKLNSIVEEKAAELRDVTAGAIKGNLLKLLAQLETSMVTRQEYMRQNKREDTKLTKLYSEENSQLNSIATWRKVLTAPQAGIVTFYLDGYEEMLSIDLAETLTYSVIRSVLDGINPTTDTRQTGIFKIVQQTGWKIAVLENNGWNPIVGQEYQFKMDDVPDAVYTATVTAVQKNGSQVYAVLSSDDPIGPLIRHRNGAASLGINLNGLSVPLKALVTENGQTGVWMTDGSTKTFIHVEVLTKDSTNALVQPVDDGALTVGMTILVN